ncbi:MAG: bifunctional acetaldehyde-CoA/alcohol dehydrogenase [Clostridiales bacterium]|nr:bifunctional acetaldehyde-CoA/alcohol dehydrogenase [Clostridiales bacterium]
MTEKLHSKTENENGKENLQALLKRVRAAQVDFSVFSQEKVDEIFKAAALAAAAARIPLAEMAVEETGMGLMEDKVIKNHYAAEYIYNRYKGEKTCGIIEEDEAGGYVRIAEPIGVAAAVIPTTNPTSTAIFKALICLKTRNGLIMSPHPRAKKCTIAAAKIVLEAAVAAGAPKDIIGWIEEPSVELSAYLMKESDIILATGGPAMVRAAYSSGKPAIGVGAGNTPAVIDESADIRLAVSSVVHSKTFDNGVICASEQAIVVVKSVYEKVKAEMQAQGCVFLSGEEKEKLRKVMFGEKGLNAQIVGQSARRIAELAGIQVREDTKVLVVEAEKVGEEEPFSMEKLSPVLTAYKTEDLSKALDVAEGLVRGGGFGHTAAIYIDERKNSAGLNDFCERMKTCRILVNTPAAQGGIGDLYNFRLTPSLTLGCGSWGGNSVCENVGISELINIKTVAHRRENMLWFRAPEKVYFKRGCLKTALAELGKSGYRRRRAFVVTDKFLYQSGMVKKVTDELDGLGIAHTEFFEVTPDPTLACAREGAKRMESFAPDVVIAVGGGSPMDAAKVMWVLYEHPSVRFEDLALRFMDIRKRVFTFPKMGQKAIFYAIPTTAGTGSEVTPFAVITDENTGHKYPLADYELMPTVAICDAELMLDIPQKLTAYAGFDALSHAVEAVGSLLASDFTNGLAYEAISLLISYLPRAFEKGSGDILAREKVANAATMAGMAFANAFLGVCHSMAHKLGARWHLPHGMANSLLLIEVMKFNAVPSPEKMGTFPQYAYPDCLARYAKVARYIGCKGETDEELFGALLEKIEEVQRVLQIPKTIKEALGAGVSESAFLESVDKMSKDAFDDQCTGANPRYPLVREIRQMYLNAYYGQEKE